MKLNERSLASYATSAAPADAQGFLLQRGRHAAYQRRWFVLRGNVLFYFEDAGSREPLGVIVLEGCTVELAEAAVDFAFAVRCPGGRARAHQLAAESQAGLERWVKALSRASVQYLRLLLRELERQLAAAQAHAPLPAPRRPRPPPARPRDNGRAAWDAASPGDPQAPPRPPPRRCAPEPLAPPHGAPFAQLHEWYGREVGALRACWQESLARP